MKIFYFLIPFGILSIVFVTGLYSETVILKSGKSLKGTVIDQDRKEIKLKQDDGNILLIQIIEILKISYKDLNDSEVRKIIELEDGKTLEKQKTNHLDETILDGLIEQNKQIIALSNEVISLSRELEKQNQRIESIEKTFKVAPKRIRWSVVARSAVLPGWGQYHWNEPIWGSVYLATFLSAVVHYNNALSDHQKAKSDYQNDFRSLMILNTGNAGIVFNFFDKNNLSSEYKKTAKSLNTAADVLVGVFLINLIDSLLYRADKDPVLTSDGKKTGLNLKAEVYQMDPFALSSKPQNISSGNVEYKIGYTWVF